MLVGQALTLRKQRVDAVNLESALAQELDVDFPAFAWLIWICSMARSPSG
jgi:hypothetical protein